MERSLNHQAPLFIGREDLFQKLRETLQSKRLVVIAAPAGTGKTAFALEYARRFSQAYRWVFYMNVASTESWLADALELAARLSLPISAEKQDLVGISEVLQSWFAQQQDYLLILDNVGGATLSSASEQTAAGHTLLLTREAIGDPAFAQMALARLGARQGALLLLRQSGQLPAAIPLKKAKPALRATATTLAQAMDGLPLALHLAASSARVAGSSLQDLLAIYRTYEQRLVQHKTSKDSATNAIAITCSLPAISLQKTLPFAAEVLWLCTVLAPSEIPRELFLQGASELTPALQEIAHNPALLDEALALLASLGLLIMNETSGVLSMQTTVQETLRHAQTQEKRDDLVVHALRAFAHLLPAQEQATPAARMRTAAQILHLATLNSGWLIPQEPVADVFCWAATLLWEYGLIQDAEMLLRRALLIYQHLLGTGHETIGIVLRNLGTLNALLKNYSEAETLFQNALLARSNVLGATHPDVILCLLDLAGIYAEQGKREEARACYQEALKIGEPALGQEHPLLVVAAHKLAIFALEDGQFAEAETYYQRVLPLYEARLGLEDSTTQACMEQMATLYLCQEKPAEAEEILRQLVTAREQTSGEADPATVEIWQKIALTDLAQEKWTQAAEIYQRLLAMYERTSGPDRPEAVQHLELLAFTYMQQSKFEQANKVLQRVLEIREHSLGANHPDVAASLVKLAELTLVQKQPDTAEPLLQRAMSIYMRSQVSDPLALSIIFDNLALAALERGLPEQAETFAETASSLRSIGAPASSTGDE